MDTSWIQPAIVACIVAASAWVAFRKLAPKAARRLVNALVRAVGREPVVVSAEAGCGSGCSSCDSCGSSPVETKTIVVHHRRSAGHPST